MPVTATKTDLLIILEALRAEVGLLVKLKMPASVPVLEMLLSDIEHAIEAAKGA
jgi:hypothetical protein